jgi:hypothetical protein
MREPRLSLGLSRRDLTGGVRFAADALGAAEKINLGAEEEDGRESSPEVFHKTAVCLPRLAC